MCASRWPRAPPPDHPGGRPRVRQPRPVAVRSRPRQPLARPVEVVQDAREQVDGGRRSVRRSAHRIEREAGAGHERGQLRPRRRNREDVLTSALDLHATIVPHFGGGRQRTQARCAAKRPGNRTANVRDRRRRANHYECSPGLPNDDGAAYPVLEAVGERGVLDAPVTFALEARATCERPAVYE